MSGTRAAVAVVVAGGLLACRDATSPGERGTFFRLTAVNALPLPFVDPPGVFSLKFPISEGIALLRPDGTFALGIDRIAFLTEGTYTRTSDGVRFTIPTGDPSAPTTVWQASRDGESFVLEVERPRLVFEFQPAPFPVASIRNASYTLSEANGRGGTPVVLSDTVVNGTRYVYRVEFDSLSLYDGVYFRQVRAESSTAYLASGDSLRDENYGLSHGSYTSTAGWLVLHRYDDNVLSYRGAFDSLAVRGETLTRSVRLRTGTQVETYTRYR